MNKYKGLILAAGRGSRMGKATEKSHKCLTVLKSRTLLDWQLSAFRKAGIKDIMLVRGYRSEMLQGDFKKAENPRWSETNMVATFFCAPEFKTDTIVSYSDIVYSDKHIEDLIEQEGDIVITADNKWFDLWSARFENPLEDAETFKTAGNNLIEIGSKNDEMKNIQAQYMGLLKFSPRGWDIAFNLFNSLEKEGQDKLDMTSFLSMLIKETEVKVVFVEGKWCEVDCYNDVEIYERILKENNNWSHDWR
jgi:L-glutamine-phosphate cytidylyltransferase